MHQVQMGRMVHSLGRGVAMEPHLLYPLGLDKVLRGHPSRAPETGVQELGV